MDMNTSFAYKMTFVSFLCFLQMVTITFGFPKQDDEPNCYSRFDYEFKVVQKLVALENAYSELQTTNEVLQREIDNLKSKITGCSMRNETFEKPMVAFTAVIHRPKLSNYPTKTVVFEKAVTNIGNGYNPGDGVFTAPYDGIYQFSTTILADNNEEVWCSIVQNGKRMASVYGRASDSRHDQGSVTLMLQLTKGDSVCIDNDRVASIYGEAYSSFSGFLLK